MVTTTSSDCLKKTIRAQLKQEIVPDIHDFDVGYVQGTNIISIQSSEVDRSIYAWVYM